MKLWQDNNPEIQRLQKQVSEALRRVEDETRARTVLQNHVRNLIQQQSSAPPAPAANQLWNGDLGHSVNSWHDLTLVTTDAAKECAFWFSHDAMTPGQTLSAVDARTNSTNNALKALAYAALTDHSKYDAGYSDWAALRGAARLQGTTTIDTPLPQNSIEAGMTVYINCILARRNAYIEVPETLRMFTGIYDNTAGQRDWLTGSIGLEAEPSDGVGGATERRYRLYIQTDRGYSILSPEVVVTNGFSNAQFAAGKEINLSWHNAAGYLYVQIWRYTPSTGEYHVLEELSNGSSSFIDNNAFLNITPAPSAYPTGTETERKAVFWTNTANLVNMAVDGATWDSFKGIVATPDNYDKLLTTDRQWLRLGTNEACNLFVEGVTTSGTAAIVAPASVFESLYAAMFAGLTVQVYDASDALLATTTIVSRDSDTQITLNASVPAGASRKVRVVGGGFHGILVDKIHLGFQDNVSFAPNALDARVLQPVASPSSGQGTVGGGGGYGGGGLCVVEGTAVHLGGFFESSGEMPVEKLQRGVHVEGENACPNTVDSLDAGFNYTRVVRWKNGIEIECVNAHRFKLNRYDRQGTPLKNLRVGDKTETRLDGKTEYSPIVYIGPLSNAKKPTYTPRLRGGQYYVAGRWRPSFRQKIMIALRLMKPRKGGALNHNRKPHEVIE